MWYIPFSIQDIPIGLLDDIHQFISQFGSRIDEVQDLLHDNRIWRHRLEHIASIAAPDALDWGCR